MGCKKKGKGKGKGLVFLIAMLFVASTVWATTVRDKMTYTGPVTISGALTTTGAVTNSGAQTYTGAVTASGGLSVTGTTPTLTVGDGGAEDAKIGFDANVNDFHIGVDDSGDTLDIGVGTTLGTDTRLSFSNATTSTTITIGDAAAEDSSLVYDGNAVDFRISLDDSSDSLEIGVGSTIETTERLTITGTGNDTVITLHDATANDAAIVWDGNAQDYYIGLDDTADDLVIGLGSAVGTTPALSIDENQVTTFNGGSIKLIEDVTATNVLTVAECGKTMFLNSTTEFSSTLPTVAGTGGCAFEFIVKSAPVGANYTVLTGNSLENVIIGGVNELEVDTGDDGPYHAAADTITFLNTSSVVGDYVKLISDGSNWYLNGQVKNDGGVQITQAD